MDNYSISGTPSNDQKTAGQITLKGELSIQHIESIRTKLENTFKDWTTVELVLKDISIIDLSMLQYLLSLKKSETNLNKTFKLTLELTEEITELLQHAGFTNTEILNQ